MPERKTETINDLADDLRTSKIGNNRVTQIYDITVHTDAGAFVFEIDRDNQFTLIEAHQRNLLDIKEDSKTTTWWNFLPINKWDVKLEFVSTGVTLQ